MLSPMEEDDAENDENRKGGWVTELVQGMSDSFISDAAFRQSRRSASLLYSMEAASFITRTRDVRRTGTENP